MITKNHSDTYAKMLLQKISLLKLSELKRQRCPDTPSYANREMSVINESGLYTLILRSNKPEAKKFKKWVTSEVLPAIRKKRIYTLPLFKLRIRRV